MPTFNPKIAVIGIAAAALVAGGIFAATTILSGQDGGDVATVEIETADIKAPSSPANANTEQLKPRVVQAIKEDVPSNNVVAVRTAHRAKDEEVAKSHEITPNQNTGGIVRISQSRALPGELISLDVIPDQGYALSGFQVVGLAGEPTHLEPDGRTFVMPDYDVVVAAVFVRLPLPDAESEDSGQISSPSLDEGDGGDGPAAASQGRTSFVVRGSTDNEGSALPEQSSYSPGDSVVLHVEWQPGGYPPTISATTDSGRGIELHEMGSQGGCHYIYTFSMPAEDVNVNAYFAALSSHSVTLHGDAQGVVKAFETYSSSYAGQEVRLTCNLPKGYGFDSWEVVTPAWLGVGTEGDSSSPICVLTMPDEDVYVKVLYSKR